MLHPMMAAGEALVSPPRMNMEARNVKVNTHGLPATNFRVMNHSEMNRDSP